MSNAGRWNDWYRGETREEPASYGSVETYELGHMFLKSCQSIEDWGCGRGYMRTLCDPNVYVGIDGSETPHADIVQDLTTRLSSPEGIFMRHVLEHNEDWRIVLDNAVASAKRKLCIVLFTPLAETTHQIAWNDIGVPDISFEWNDIVQPMARKFTNIWSSNLSTDTQYGQETIFYADML